LETTSRPSVERPLRAAGAAAPITTDLARCDPSRSVVNRALREHLETILARFAETHRGRTLPAHVERERRAA